MHWVRRLKMHYVKGIPYSVSITTCISTYLSVKNEMSRRVRIPYVYSLKNIIISGGIGALTGLCYPITFPYFCTLYIYSIYK